MQPEVLSNPLKRGATRYGVAPPCTQPPFAPAGPPRHPRAPTPSWQHCPTSSLSPTFLVNNQGLVLAAEGATELAGRGGGDVMDS